MAFSLTLRPGKKSKHQSGIIMNRKTITAGLFAVLAAAGLSFSVWAHSGATGVVKKRMEGMKVMGSAMGEVGDMFKGKREFDAERIAASARTVRTHALEIEKLFPDTPMSRTSKVSEALPAIWKKPEEFRKLARRLAERATALESTAGTGDKRKIRIDFARLAKTCASCHTDFRKPKN